MGAQCIPAARLLADLWVALQPGLGGINIARPNVSALANQLSINRLNALIIASLRIALQIIPAGLVWVTAFLRGIG